MTSEESNASERFEAIFAQAIELGEAECRAYLEQACGDDLALRQQLEELIAAERERSRFMEDPGLNHAEMDPMLGVELGPYTIQECLGEGGYGVVYLPSRATGTHRSSGGAQGHQVGHGHQASDRAL